MLLGKEAQQLLAPLLDGRPADKPVFSPAESRELHYQQCVPNGRHPCNRRRPAARRPTPNANPKSVSIAAATSRPSSCREKAFPPPAGTTKAEMQTWNDRHRWHVHQLRHNAATHLVKQFGWDVARIVLGHSTVDATRIYARRISARRSMPSVRPTRPANLTDPPPLPNLHSSQPDVWQLETHKPFACGFSCAAQVYIYPGKR